MRENQKCHFSRGDPFKGRGNMSILLTDPLKDTTTGLDDGTVFTHREQYTRHANTTMKLFTGGRAIAGRKSLFVITGGAYEIFDPRAVPSWGNYPSPWGADLNSIATAPANVKIGTLGNLGSDHIRYVMIPDGADPIDITPKVAGSQFYTYWVNVEKHSLSLTASSSLTNADLEIATPTFSVGERVSFTLSGLAPYVALIGNWSLPGNFVNEKYRYSLNCESYRKQSFYLQNIPNTDCWFVNGPGGKVTAAFNVEFSNGQQVIVIKKGNVVIYRPTIASVEDMEREHYYTLGSDITPMTTLRLGDSNGDGGMFFAAWINSSFGFGVVNITQLITASNSNPSLYFTDWRADSGEFYNVGGDVRVTCGSLPTGPASLADGPVSIFDTPNVIVLNARDYVRFKPDGDYSIWVTLGVITWSTHGEASRTPPAYGLWTITVSSTTGPSQPDTTDEFPVWQKIALPGR